METFAENGLTANQLHLCPEITNSTGQDSPLSEPRHDPSNQSVPEIMVTECSPTKPGLDSTSILDWSMSCNSVSGTSSDLQQNGIETSADGSQSWSNANADSNVNGSMSTSENEVACSLPSVQTYSDVQNISNPSSVDPESSSSFITSSSDPTNCITTNNVTPADDFPSLEPFQREASEHTGGDSDEEYFEEYHLPNTHENAFVRHLSFRRKVQTTPIHAPDAERIEGLVRTGEFVRHGSIRKKILPEEPLQEQYEDGEEDLEAEEKDQNDSSFTQNIERDIRELERYLSEDNIANRHFDEPSSLQRSDEHSLENRTTSTPKSVPAPSVFRPDEHLDHDVSSLHDTEVPKLDLSETEYHEDDNTNIEESTIRKIQECLDFSAYKDMLNLSGRLSDILLPKEVEEVLSHSERYRHYLDSEVIEALSLSFKSQSQSLPYSINTSSSSCGNPSPSKRAESRNSSPIAEKVVPRPESENPDENDQDALDSRPLSDDLLLVRRSSVAFDGIRAPGIFVEAAPAPNSEMRKIAAPRINLDWTPESKRDSTSEGESFHVESSEEQQPISSRKRIQVNTEAILNDSDNHDNFINIESDTTENSMHTAFSPSSTEIVEGDISTAPPPPDLIPELTAAEEFSEMRHWRNVVIGGAWRRIDMKVIAPYRKCISHGGYMEDSQSPIVVLSAALLPDRTRKDYHYVMDNLFMYVLSFLEQLVADDYVLVYFSEDLNQRSAPGFHWLRRAYQMIDRRLRKNLKALLLVHPSLWARTILTLSRPFVSSKFYRKLHYVRHLIDLAQLVPLEQLEIPDIVKQADFEIMIREKKSAKTRR